MIAIYFIAAIISVLVFILTMNLVFIVRILLSVGVFVVLVCVVTIWLMKIGDRPLPDSTTVSPEDIGKKK